MAPLKSYFKGLPEMFSGFQIQEDLRGHNNSKQYIGGVSYRSVITGKDEKIKIEISLREPVLEPVERKAAQTLLLNPQTNNPMFDAIKVNTLSYRESYAEKFRAALTRRKPAARDIYDIEMALRSGLDVNDSAFIRLIQKKLAVPGTDPVNLFLDKAGELRKQQEGKLKPVLRDADYQGFNIEKTLAVVTGLVDTLNRLEQGSRQRIKSP